MICRACNKMVKMSQLAAGLCGRVCPSCKPNWVPKFKVQSKHSLKFLEKIGGSGRFDRGTLNKGTQD